MSKKADKAPQDQKQAFYLAQARISGALRTFVEIQQGPNPLTNAEIVRLVQRHPKRYSFLRAYIKKDLKRSKDS